MPDLDVAQLKITYVTIAGIRPFVPVSIATYRVFGHWGWIYGWGIWTGIMVPMSVIIGWLPAAAMSLGYASHLLGDACTKSGIPLLYPKRQKWHLLPKRWRVTTGSGIEEVLFVLFVLFVVPVFVFEVTHELFILWLKSRFLSYKYRNSIIDFWIVNAIHNLHLQRGWPIV